MARALLGRKLGMTQIFTEDGTRLACTVLEVGPCRVLQKKSSEGRDGYDAIKLGFEEVPERKLSRPRLGTFQKLGLSPQRHVRELRVSASELKDFEVGQEITANLFQIGDRLDVTGVSKGRGFAGVMKRHGFRGAKRTHGSHEAFRHGGSIGMCAWPGKVIKGQKMAGQHGNRRRTVQNLQVVRMHPDQNLVLVKGAVPGPAQGLIFVREAVRQARAARS